MNYDKVLSQTVKDIKPSGIRRFFNLANEMENVISLGVGEPDFKTPWAVRRAGIQALEAGKTWYTANAGMAELKSEISNYMARRFQLNYKPDELFVTVGGSEAIDMCIRALVEPGDEVMVCEPSFVCYSPIAALSQAKVVPIATKAENGFSLTPEELKAAISPKSKLLIMPFPSNPTGGIMTKEQLEAIADVLRGTDIMVLSDEIYGELTYGGIKHYSLANIPDMWERTIVVNGFSKAYAMTGWRLGYACGPKPIIDQMLKIHQYAVMCAPTVSQFAAIVAMKSCDDAIAEMRDEYDMRRRMLVDRLNAMGLTCFEPRGAFYVFPSIKSTGLTSAEFCEQLLNAKRVAVIPGDAFGECGEGYVRISYSYSMEHLITALERIAEFLKEIK
ncbi:pyridoxal phosphate-dependent aminotransferase [Oscillospiraceae bacterium LTW-04]|nr:aminotransferase class I/II-fold pyridoxal phosphate-dependent enzyme [Oscillospiraceae bacterium MB24-C1]